MSLAAADLYEIAKLFFPNSVTGYVTSHDFYRDTKRQYIVLAAIRKFAVGDGFFKALGDNPMPSYTPPGVGDLCMAFGRLIYPAKLEDRIRSNSLQRLFIKQAFEPFWQNPETYVPVD